MVHQPLLKFRDSGDYYLEVDQNDCECNSSKLRNCCARSAKPLSRHCVRKICSTLGFLLFLLALSSSLYLFWKWNAHHETSGIYLGEIHTNELKLVTIFNRHGDRAPSDELPDVDKHKHVIEFFWPNGLHNLTDLGKIRSYKLGLALRNMYDGYVGYDHRQVLAFSSKKLRCIESLQNTLKGFYELEGPKSRGLNTIAKWSLGESLPEGSGSADEWKLIRFDTESIRTLTERDVEQCSYRKENPSPLDLDLKLHPGIMALPGIKRLEQIMVQRYGLTGLQGGIMTGIFSTITSELNLVRTSQSIGYSDHYSDWIGEVVATSPDGQYNITLYDIFEQASVYKYRDQTLGVAKWLEIGPMITSVVDSQLVALNRSSSGSNSFIQEELYQDKRIIFYSSHDSILQRILQHFDLIDFGGNSTFEERFFDWKQRGGSEMDKFMSGLSMSAYGLSIKFELWEATSASGRKFSKVQMSIYNQEEGRFGELVYEPLRLGFACGKLFEKKYETPGAHLQFYDPEFPTNVFFDCPFELFKNVTADLMVEEAKFNELC